MRVIIGLIKGLVVGGAIGYGLLRLGWVTPAIAYLACAAVGAIVGVVAGRAPWQAETIWTPALKMIVGALIGVGLAALGLHFAPNADVPVKALQVGLDAVPFRSGPILAPLVGVLYGIFVEVDDGGGKGKKGAAGAEEAAPKAKKPPTKPTA
jgi:hypothetical protein